MLTFGKNRRICESVRMGPLTGREGTVGRNKPAISRLSLGCLALAVGVALAFPLGCQTSRTSMGYRHPLPPKPRKIVPAPADARADALVLTLSTTPRDTNGNGYADLIDTTTYLFDRRYDPSFHESGVFVFSLYETGGAAFAEAQPIREWRFEPQQVALARSWTGFGLCYRFRLSLIDGGTDRLDIGMADMRCRFEPADGRKPMDSSAVSSIQVGRRILLDIDWKSQDVPPSPEVDAWP